MDERFEQNKKKSRQICFYREQIFLGKRRYWTESEENGQTGAKTSRANHGKKQMHFQETS